MVHLTEKEWLEFIHTEAIDYSTVSRYYLTGVITIFTVSVALFAIISAIFNTTFSNMMNLLESNPQIATNDWDFIIDLLENNLNFVQYLFYGSYLLIIGAFLISFYSIHIMKKAKKLDILLLNILTNKITGETEFERCNDIQRQYLLITKRITFHYLSNILTTAINKNKRAKHK